MSAENLASNTPAFTEMLGDSQLVIRLSKDSTPWLLQGPSAGIFADSENILAALDMPLQTAFVDRTEPGDEEASGALNKLAEGKIAFTEIDEQALSPVLLTAKELFDTDKAGIALRTEVLDAQSIPGLSQSILDGFPALAKDGRNFRLLWRQHGVDPKDLESVLNILALPTEVKESEAGILAITELVDDAERPTSISPEELEDWLDRLRSAGVELGVDVDADDNSLDNFLRYQGRLCWCDGDIMQAQRVASEQMELQISKWRETLAHFVSDEARS